MFWGIIILGIIVLFFIVSYNGFITLRNKVEEAFATMDVYLKKRYDLIPNLINAIKGYMTHEKETLENVVRVRNQAMKATSIEERQDYENSLSQTLKSIFALSEGYPDLKADSQFIDLQQQLQKTEDDIANGRKYYNAIAKLMNTKIERFPSNLVALVFGFKRIQYFTINSEEREPVKVEF